MNKIIEMARDAGIRNCTCDGTRGCLERFADLVRADEREAWEHKYARLQSLMEIRETQPNKPCCLAERKRLLQAVEEMRPVQNNPLLQNKPPEFWIRSFKQAIEARGNT